MRFVSPRYAFESFSLLLLRDYLLVKELITGFSHFTAALPLHAGQRLLKSVTTYSAALSSALEIIGGSHILRSVANKQLPNDTLIFVPLSPSLPLIFITG